MSTYKNRTTPGVYITELNAFPSSIPGVQTAVPAFIGYTAHALIGGKPAYFKPVEINSLVDYQAIFGGAFDPIYTIDEVHSSLAVPSDYDFAAEAWVPSSLPTHGSYQLKYYDIKPPSGVTATPPGLHEDTAVPEMGLFNLYNSVRLFYANGGGTCFICSVGKYSSNGVSEQDLQDGLDAVGEQAGPTMLVIPDAVLLAADSTSLANGLPTSKDFRTLCKKMLDQCARLQDRVALLDVYGTQALNPAQPATGTFDSDVNTLIDNFQLDVGENFLNYGMAYFPFLVSSIIQASEITYLNFADAADKNGTLQKILIDEASYLYPDLKAKSASPDDNENATYKKVKKLIDEISKTTDATTPEGAAKVTSLNQNLRNAIPLLAEMENDIAVKMSLLPASGAMAGVYTFNDSTRGVWNAPANIALNSVIAPSVKVGAALQGPINAPINGKAVNVIRDFVGRGPVVWGARTLDANSNDWRYIQVRRTLVYIETSVKAALNQFVFAPNDGTTWVAVTAMVSNFLQNLWQQGGLMGAKPDEAFTVQCGLGSTMTGMDILQGYMIVQITLQMIRPAEFIELTFKQKMEGVA